jgi:uncharacterized membrane protein
LKLRLITGVLFFARQIKLQSVRFARVSGVLFFARQIKLQSVRFARVSGVLFFENLILNPSPKEKDF